MTYIESNDVIFKLVFGVVSGSIAATLGYTPLVFWPDKSEKEPAPTDKAWLRVSRATMGERLSGFSDGESQSIRRYDVTSKLYVQFFYPASDKNSSVKFPVIVQAMKDALRDRHDDNNELWTRESVVKEVDSEKAWFRKNVVVDFEYQEIKE